MTADRNVMIMPGAAKILSYENSLMSRMLDSIGTKSAADPNATTTNDHVITHIWDTATGALLGTRDFTNHPDLAATLDHKHLCGVALPAYCLEIIDAETGKVVYTTTNRSRRAYCTYVLPGAPARGDSGRSSGRASGQPPFC